MVYVWNPFFFDGSFAYTLYGRRKIPWSINPRRKSKVSTYLYYTHTCTHIQLSWRQLCELRRDSKSEWVNGFNVLSTNHRSKKKKSVSKSEKLPVIKVVFKEKESVKRSWQKQLWHLCKSVYFWWHTFSLDYPNNNNNNNSSWIAHIPPVIWSTNRSIVKIYQ